MKQDLLSLTGVSLLIVERYEPSSLVIGVPHHIPGGIEKMPCSEHEYGDENAGYIGKFIADTIRASFICASNYFIDSNKKTNSDYYQAIERCRPKYLVEVHGHGLRTEETTYDVEISCGSKEKEYRALELQREIERLIERNAEKHPCWTVLQDLRIEGDFSRIYFRATRTNSIQDPRWTAFHIELSLRLRVDEETKSVPDLGLKFREILSEAIAQVCK